mmetsp:Transcript_16106/g.28959  ORF Transcript_16106/g.28959 Transcript_16106/m.28959 type:complete len:501 (+) Transcript_16106:143-1645(+)
MSQRSAAIRRRLDKKGNLSPVAEEGPHDLISSTDSALHNTYTSRSALIKINLKSSMISCAIISSFFIWFCAQVAFEAKSIMGVELGHERAVAINSYIHIPGMLRRGVNWFGQSEYMMTLSRVMGGKESRRAWKHAQDYYLSQKSIVIQNAKTWELHKSLEPMKHEVVEGMTFYDIIAARARVFYANLQAHAWTDFEIEKDKCHMYHFLYNNGFPHCPVIKEWNDLNSFSAEGDEVRQTSGCQHLPYCFVKMCHITMGHLNSAKRLSPGKSWGDVVAWAEHLWDKKPVDWDRTWGPTFDKLTATLQPSVMIQHGFKGGRDNGKDSPVELKIEVVWGRAYLAYVTQGSHACGSNPILLRDGTVAEYLMKDYLTLRPDPCHEWIFKEGHADIVWHMAEAFAKTAGIDSIRVDVFITQGADPRSAVVNEISLSSGAGYAWHWQFFTDLWVQGYQAREGVVSGKDWPDPMQEIKNGPAYYSKVLSKCNSTLIQPELFEKHCGFRG